MVVCANLNQPWISTLSLLQSCKTTRELDQIHSHLITTGFINNSSLTTKLILTLSSSPQHPLFTDFSRQIFMSKHAFVNNKNGDKVRSKEDEGDPFLWNAVIKSYSHGVNPEEAFVIFCLMIENGICIDKYSLSLVLKACARVGLVEKGMQVHGFIIKLGSVMDVFLENCLVGLYLRCGCVGFAQRVFDRIVIRDSVSFNSMIDGYVKCGMIELARELFDSMEVEFRNLITWNSIIRGYMGAEDGLGVAMNLFEKMPERDMVTWNIVVDGCLKQGKMDVARKLFDRMPGRDVVSWVNMITAYAKLGSMDIASLLFKEIPEKDVIACNALMAGYVDNGCCREALDVYYDMLSEGNLRPDETTLSIALSAVAKLGQLDEGVAMHCYIDECNFSLSGKLGVALIDMYSKCGSINDAYLVFDGEGTNVDHWNAMIGGLSVHGFGELSFELFMEMQRKAIKPDDITFVGVLNACGHSGLLKEGLLCFELMRRLYKIEPKLQHYGCLVDMLGRAGRIEEAKTFIGEMPIEPNDVIWRSLLSACRNHENLNTGVAVAKRIIELDSCNTSSYILLSNLYAGSSMWSDVRRVREYMKDAHLKKLPGCSWIELQGNVHEFFVKDESHPQVAEIHSILDGLSLLKLQTA